MDTRMHITISLIIIVNTVAACSSLLFFFFNDPAPPEIYTLPLPDALPIPEYDLPIRGNYETAVKAVFDFVETRRDVDASRIGLWGVSLGGYYAPRATAFEPRVKADRKSTRLNSSHLVISYAVFCLKKKISR